MLPKTPTRTALLFVLSAVSLVAVCYAEVTLKHTCFFDEMNKDGNESNLPKVQYLKKQTASTQHEWKFMRIKLSAADLNDATKHCATKSSKVTDVFGATVQCTTEDILTDTKKQHLFQFVRTAIALHATRLKVKPIQHGFKVPELTAPLCKFLTVPAEHKSKGVADADTILYVTSLPSSKNEMFAAGAPCALLQSDNRPVVGALTYTTKRIAQSEYSVRVATHEIAHALGFTYRMMKDVLKMQIAEKKNVRHKSSVTELQTATAIQKTKEHYSCWSATGMELEDEAGILSTPSHSHWERRNALEDLMAGIVTTGKYTSITLAAFEDMGVYKAEYDLAEAMDWGKKFKCEFLTKRCVGDKVDFSSMFCSDTNNKNMYYCAPGRRALGKCSKLEWDKYAAPQNQYFRYWNLWGYALSEKRLLTDRCPIYEEETDASCAYGADGVYYGLKGPTSWCLRRLGGVLDGHFPYKGICGEMVNSYDHFNKVKTQSTYSRIYGPPCKHTNNDYAITVKPVYGTDRFYQCPSHNEVTYAVGFESWFRRHNTTEDTANVVSTSTPTISLTEISNTVPMATEKANDVLPDNKDTNDAEESANGLQTKIQAKPLNPNTNMAPSAPEKENTKLPTKSNKKDAQQTVKPISNNASCAPQMSTMIFMLFAVILFCF